MEKWRKIGYGLYNYANGNKEVLQTTAMFYR